MNICPETVKYLGDLLADIVPSKHASVVLSQFSHETQTVSSLVQSFTSEAFQDIPLESHLRCAKQLTMHLLKDAPLPDDNEFGYIVLRTPNQTYFGCVTYLFPSKESQSSLLQFTDKVARYASVVEMELSRVYHAQVESDLQRRCIAEHHPDINIQSFIDSFYEQIWIKSLDGDYIACNRSAELSWQLNNSQIVGKSDEDLFDPSTVKEFLHGDTKAILNGKPTSVSESEAVDRSNTKEWLETIKAPMLNLNGELIGTIGLAKNIAKHKAAEEQLLLAASVFENIIEGVIITDSAGTITDINDAFTNITGYSRKEVIGQTPRILRSGRHDSQFYEKLWNTLLVQGRWQGEIWNRRKSGAIFPQIITISAVFDKDLQAKNYVAVFTDISAQKQTEEKLNHLGNFDPLTKLPNRIQFLATLEQEINHAQRLNHQLAVIFIDVDFFKHINDSLGHLAGDEIIIELSKRLASVLSEQDSLARLAGDEFAVLLPNYGSSDYVSSTIQRLRSVFDQAFFINDAQSIRLTASMGISIFPDDATDHDSLLRHADSAKHRVKMDGRNSYAFYNESMTRTSVEQLKLQTSLHQALVREDFFLVYQPKVNIRTGETIGYETLVRWLHPEYGIISPAVFIPLAEKIGLICDIGMWVLEQACLQAKKWRIEGKLFGRMAVNVASLQIQRPDFVAQVMDILQRTGLPAECLELELTESCMMNNPDEIIRDLKVLGDKGILLSVDDFGTGFSSMNYLKKLPIDVLKIDQSFIRDIPNDTNSTAIAKAVIALAHAMNIDVIAEGVETQQQADFLSSNKCDFAQGYLYSKPLKPELF